MHTYNLQIENEYGSEAKSFGAAGQAYMNWAANMAVGMDTGVPWVMCKEDDAPDPVVCFYSFLRELCCGIHVIRGFS